MVSGFSIVISDYHGCPDIRTRSPRDVIIVAEILTTVDATPVSDEVLA